MSKLDPLARESDHKTNHLVWDEQKSQWTERSIWDLHSLIAAVQEQVKFLCMCVCVGGGRSRRGGNKTGEEKMNSKKKKKKKKKKKN